MGHATVAPSSQGLRAQAPSPSFTEGTHDFAVLGFQRAEFRGTRASPSDDIHPSAAIFALGATPMDGWHLALFLIATYFGGLTSGLSGFAMGLVVSGVWLHLMTPQQNALLIVLCGLVTQGAGIWRVRHAINWRAVAPYIIGGAIGIPLGIALVTTVDPTTIRFGIGVLLLAYSLYSLI